MDVLPAGFASVVDEHLTLKGVDGVPIPAFRARPESMPRAGLVVHPDIGGLRELFFQTARTLASHGFAVLVVEPFGREPGVETLDVPARIAATRHLSDDAQLGDLAAAADRLVVDDDVRDVYVLGFCMGGMQVLKAAATDRFDRAVAFYGMLRVPEEWRPTSLGDPLDVAAAVCPTLAIFGGRDALVPIGPVAELRSIWAGRSDCEIVVYDDAEHGFAHDPDRPAHRPGDAADAWRRTLRFLGADPEPVL